MSVTSRTTRLKLVFGIVIPVLVLVTTAVMVGMSFAWFSQETDATVQSINLSTQKAFMLEFSGDGTQGDNIKYKGQKALSSSGGIVSPYDINASDASYIIEAPYFFVTPIQISTDGISTDISLKLENIIITQKNGADGEALKKDSYIEGDAGYQTLHDSANVPLAFTWFFKEHIGGDPATTKPTNWNWVDGDKETHDEQDEKEMKTIFPVGAETWYTPYGTLTFTEGASGARNYVTTRNGAPISSVTDWESFSTESIKDFTADNETVYDFYIVFAPEQLFWSQFFDGGAGANVKTLYNETQQKEIFGTTKDSIYYSAEAYMGSTFSFGALLEVVSDVSAPQP